MSEAWALAVFYFLASLGGGFGIIYGWREHRRARELEINFEAEVDIAYLDGFDDGQNDRVIAQDWPPRGDVYIEIERPPAYLSPGGQLELPPADDGGQADALEPLPAGRADDPELAEATAWLDKLRERPPFDPPTDERLERVVLPLLETDTGWIRRVDLEQGEAWEGSTARVDELAEIYYRKMGHGDG